MPPRINFLLPPIGEGQIHVQCESLGLFMIERGIGVTEQSSGVVIFGLG